MLSTTLENHHKQCSLQLESPYYEVDVLGTFCTSEFSDREVATLATTCFITFFGLSLTSINISQGGYL
jgi:hypothetical protein